MLNASDYRELILNALERYTIHTPEKHHSRHGALRWGQKILSRVQGHGPAGIRRFTEFSAVDQKEISAAAYITAIAGVFSTIYQNEGDTSKWGSMLMNEIGEILKNYFKISESNILKHSPREPQASNVMGTSMFSGYRYDKKMGLALAIRDQTSYASPKRIA